jgi:hypothetical protein
MRMASAAFGSAGRPVSQVAAEFFWNGFRSLMDDPGPKITAARMSEADYQNLNQKEYREEEEESCVINICILEDGCASN